MRVRIKKTDLIFELSESIKSGKTYDLPKQLILDEMVVLLVSQEKRQKRELRDF